MGVPKRIHFSGWLLVAVALITVAAASLFTPSAYADPAADCAKQGPNFHMNADGTECVQDGAKDTTSDKTKSATCAVEKIGWFLCPVIEQSAKLSDKAFGFLADNFLRTDPQLFSDKSGTRTAWEMSRNLANVMFILAFLAIIVAQVTGLGISNYGIKKMLPRLVVAAVAVNVSYYICQLAVDLSNILGYELQNALVGISNNLGPSVFGQAGAYQGTEQSTSMGNGLTTIAVGALAVAGVVWLIMGPLMSVVMMVVITVITIIVILLLRKALIVLLIVASPVAFVLYLLPNTEKYFSKWLNMFIQLLLVFPVVGLLLGGGKLAGTIILVSGAYGGDAAVNAAKDCDPSNANSKSNFTEQIKNSPTDSGADTSCGMGAVVYSSTDTGDTNCGGTNGGCVVTASWQLGLIATGVTVIPLFAVYSVLQGALSAAGAIGGKIQTIGNRARGSAAKRAEASDKARQNYMQNKYAKDGGGPIGAIYRRRNRKDAKRAGVQRELGRNQQEYIAGEILGDDKFASKVAGSKDPAAIARAQASAQGVVSSTNAEEIKNTKAQYEQFAGNEKNLGDAFEAAVKRGDMAAAKGLQEMLFEAGEGGGDAFIAKVKSLETQGFGGSATMQGVQQHIAANQGQIKGSNAGVYYWGAEHASGKSIGDASFSSENIVSKLTDSQIATQSKSSLSSLGPSISQARAAAIINNSNVRQAAKGAQQKMLDNVSKGLPIDTP